MRRADTLTCGALLQRTREKVPLTPEKLRPRIPVFFIPLSARHDITLYAPEPAKTAFRSLFRALFRI